MSGGDCNINRITHIGEREGFETYIIPHESSLASSGMQKPETRENIGVVGVACILNLIGGGWKIKSLGIPAQCVLLDYSGCNAHWHDQGMVTAINLNRLLEIMHLQEID